MLCKWDEKKKCPLTKLTLKINLHLDFLLTGKIISLFLNLHVRKNNPLPFFPGIFYVFLLRQYCQLPSACLSVMFELPFSACFFGLFCICLYFIIMLTKKLKAYNWQWAGSWQETSWLTRVKLRSVPRIKDKGGQGIIK